jgi:hypothetical protein
MFKIVASSLFAILLSSCASLNDGKSSQPSAPIQGVNLAENMSQAESINTDSLQTFLENVSKNHQIPLADLKRAFEDTKAIPSIKKLVMPPPQAFKKIGKSIAADLLNPDVWLRVRNFGQPIVLSSKKLKKKPAFRQKSLCQLLV